MKIKRSTRLILSFLFLISFYIIAGYISLKNLEKGRTLSSKSTLIYQPSIILLNEIKLVIINSKNYINTWVNIDLTDHKDKLLLKKIHDGEYNQLKIQIQNMSSKWSHQEHIESLVLIINHFDKALSEQKIIMAEFNDFDDYNKDLLTRINIENKLEYGLNPNMERIIRELDVLINTLKAKEGEESKKIVRSFELIKRSNIIINISVILITLIVGFVSMRSLKHKEEKIKVTEERDEVIFQKKVIEEKNNEILKSINYAKRIQHSILPSENQLKQSLKEYFVLYEPKDIVSGDFYWMNKSDQNDLFIAAADSTGHGVPGALVSLIAYNSLNSSLKEFNITKPSSILDKTRELIKASLGGADENQMQDGMDIALCKFNFDAMQMEFSGAYNSLYIIRDKKINEYKASRQPVGAFEHASPFKNYEIQLQKNDKIYFFTDGFVDQFGGDRGKKYKVKPFLKFLTSIHDLPMKKQQTKLKQEFIKWKGKEEQVDDMLVIGVSI